MKIGRDPQADFARVAAAREAIGEQAFLFVDANGAYPRKQALNRAEIFKREQDVRWFEEPVTSDDLEGLRLLRDRAPAGMDMAAGEYGYDLYYFRRMLEAGPGPWMCSRLTLRAAVGSLGSCRLQHFAGRMEFPFRPTPRPLCTCTPVVLSCRFATWNISTITFALSACSSTESRNRTTANCSRTGHVRGWAWN